MTDEEKINALQRLLQGANVAQVNLGDGYQTFNVGKDGNCQQERTPSAEYADAEVVGDHSAQTSGNAESDKEHELCIVLNKDQRAKLLAAEAEGIISYNSKRKGYDTGRQSSNALVAYLCGRLFCSDNTDKHGHWKSGCRFDDAQYCKELFGFDVAGTRRSTQGNGAGKSPIGHERVDKLFE